MEAAPTYLAAHQEQYSTGHAGGGRLSVESTHPRQLKQKSAPLILQPWRRAGSRDSRLVFEVGRFEFKVWYLERSCASSLNFIALVAKLCLPSLSPRQLCESRAARLRSAPLSLFCSPAYLCFFSSSPLSSPARLRGEDDVKLKNGIS